MKYVLTLVLLCFVIIYSWNTAWLLPLKWLVVFFHESSHAIATVLTGGTVESLRIVPEQGGQVISLGGHRFIILSAGYLGSLLIGLLLFVITIYTRSDRWVTGLLGIILLLITWLYADNLFSQLFGSISGSIFCLIAFYLPDSLNDLINRLIALTNLMYVPLDIYSDTLERDNLPSDAVMLAQEFGGTGQLWGGAWLIISIILIFVCLKWSLQLEIRQERAYHARKYRP
jgi:hypothetical protein